MEREGTIIGAVTTATTAVIETVVRFNCWCWDRVATAVTTTAIGAAIAPASAVGMCGTGMTTDYLGLSSEKCTSLTLLYDAPSSTIAQYPEAYWQSIALLFPSKLKISHKKFMGT